MKNTRPQLRLLTAQYACLQAGYYICYASVYAFASAFLQARGFPNTQIGMIIALPGIASVVLQPALAAYADHPGAMRVGRINTLLLVGALALAAALALVPLGYVGTAVLFGLLNTMVLTGMPLVNAMGMAHIDQGRPINFGLARGVGSIAYGAVAYGLGQLNEKYSPAAVLPWSYLLFLAFFLVCSATFCSAARAPRQDAQAPAASGSPAAFFRRYPRFALLLAGVVLIFTFHYAFNNYMLQIMQYMGGGSAEFGVGGALAAALELPMMGVFILLAQRIRPSTLLKASCIAFAVKAGILLAATNVYWVYASQVMQFFSFALFIPASVYYANQLMDGADKVKGQAYMTVTMTLGGVIGSLCGGWMIDRLGMRAMLAVIAAAAVLGAAIACAGTQKISAIAKRPLV